MNKASRLLLVFAAISGAAYAAPFLAMGDNAELFLTGAATVKYDDNIYLAASNAAKEDVILTVTPGFDVVFGKGSATKGNFYYREDFLTYADHSQQDTSLSNVGLNAVYDGARSTFSFGGSYAQVAQNTVDVRIVDQIVRRKVSNLHGLSEFGLTEKTSLGVGASYDNTAYGPSGYSDLRTWSIPLDVYSAYSEKLAVSAGYRFRDSRVNDGGIDSKDHFFNLGARGEFTPKVNGQVRFGYTRREFDVGSSQSLFGMEGNLTYQATGKTSYLITFANDFGNAGTGDSTKSFSLGLSANSRLTEQWGVNAGVNYRGIKYPNHKDDFWTGQIGVNYAYNAFVNFTAGYNYTKNESNLAGGDFSDNMFSIGASIRY